MSHPLALTGLSKRYGDQTVVDGVDLRIEAGRCHGLLGPNGAGKTTTLRLALGLTQADAGDIRLLGHPIPAEATLARARVGVVPQADSLDPDFTVRENLHAYGRYFGMRRAEIGHHHHIAGKYLLRYAQESAWREDHRRVDNGRQVQAVTRLALAAPTSVDWCGYWQRAIRK